MSQRSLPIMLISQSASFYLALSSLQFQTDNPLLSFSDYFVRTDYFTVFLKRTNGHPILRIRLAISSQNSVSIRLFSFDMVWFWCKLIWQLMRSTIISDCGWSASSVSWPSILQLFAPHHWDSFHKFEVRMTSACRCFIPATVKFIPGCIEHVFVELSWVLQMLREWWRLIGSHETWVALSNGVSLHFSIVSGYDVVRENF